jgi:hypothetical protein
MRLSGKGYCRVWQRRQRPAPPSLAYALKQRQSAWCIKDKNGTGREAFLSTITADDLAAALTGDPEALDIHLSLVERGVVIDGCQVKIHCHCLTVDGNGRVQPHRLTEFMRNAVADYAIPRSQLAKAKARDAKYNSTEAVTALVEQARRSFTDLARTGEGGEMLLFLLAERFLKLPQVLCKMDLKTDTRMHYHGADGVYAGVTPEGMLKLYWGESKIYKDATTAIKDCLASVAPFLIEPEHEDAERERDLILLSDKADLSDPGLTAALTLLRQDVTHVETRQILRRRAGRL